MPYGRFAVLQPDSQVLRSFMLRHQDRRREVTRQDTGAVGDAIPVVRPPAIVTSAEDRSLLTLDRCGTYLSIPSILPAIYAGTGLARGVPNPMNQNPPLRTDNANLDLIRAVAVMCVFFAHLWGAVMGHSDLVR